MIKYLTHLPSKYSCRQEIREVYIRSVLTLSSRRKYCTVLQQEYCKGGKKEHLLCRFSHHCLTLNDSRYKTKVAILLAVLEPQGVLSSQSLQQPELKNYIVVLVLVLFRSTAFLRAFWPLLAIHTLLDVHIDKWVPTRYTPCDNSAVVIKPTPPKKKKKNNLTLLAICRV